MGVISDGDRYAILSDILGDEDHLGDMDFKVTGTVDGITACQMDIKIKGLSYEILDKALKQARDGRLHILEKISETIDKPNESVKAHAPKMVSLTIPNEFIGAVIGPGGKVIQEMQKETDTTIVIEEDGELGVIEILGVNQEIIDAAIERINNITFKPEVGKIYEGKVVKTTDFGAFVNFLGSKDGLVHISQLKEERVEKTTDVVNEGDVVKVKVIGVDDRGKVKLSIKEV